MPFEWQAVVASTVISQMDFGFVADKFLCLKDGHLNFYSTSFPLLQWKANLQMQKKIEASKRVVHHYQPAQLSTLGTLTGQSVQSIIIVEL